MFAPRGLDIDELQLAISLPELDSVSNGVLIPLNRLVDSPLLDPSLDALFVSGLFPEQSRNLIATCESKGLELVVFENPSNDLTAIKDVVLNITDKLYSNEMPNNIDLADIRNLNRSSDYLFAFNSKRAALNFMDAQEFGVVIGSLYLAHGGTELDEYEAVNKELSHYISRHGFLCSSLHSSGSSECTILLGIKRH